MKIQSTLTQPSRTKPALDAKSLINKSAVAAGGALGGMALGAVGGKLLANTLGNDVFLSAGPLAGGLAGAATSFAASLSDDPSVKKRAIGAYLSSSLGATAGMYALGGLGNALAAGGASAMLGANGALIGSLAGGVVGASLAFVGHDGKFSEGLKSAGRAGAAGTAGIFLGGGAQAVLSQFPPELIQGPAVSSLAGSMPVVGGLAGAVIGLTGDGPLEHRGLTSAAVSGLFGYGVGVALGGVAHALGGSPAYLFALPSAGLVTGAALGYSEDRDALGAKSAGTVAGVTASTALGATLGDAVGQGLTALTGNPIYGTLGAGLGAINGASFGMGGRLAEKCLGVSAGLAAGSVGGALTGALVTAFTGSQTLGNTAAALGAVAGGLTGLALTFKEEAKAA